MPGYVISVSRCHRRGLGHGCSSSIYTLVRTYHVEAVRQAEGPRREPKAFHGCSPSIYTLVRTYHPSSIIMRGLDHPFYPHFTPFLTARTTFKKLGPLLKNAFSTHPPNFISHKNAFRYIIQNHHHIIYLTYTSKSFQLNSISYIHTKQSSHNIYISNIYI